MNVLTNLEAEFLDENTTERKLDANLTIAENDKNRKAKSLCTPGIFENTFGADAESKIKFVKTFIAADVLYDVFRQLDEHISVVETKRYQEWIDQKLEALRSKSSKV